MDLNSLLGQGDDPMLNPVNDESNPDFLARLKKVLPAGARITSDQRSVGEQDALARRGVTKARGPNAPHVRVVDGRAGAVDIGGDYGNPDALVASLNKSGFAVTKALVEKGGVNDGTGPHAHLELGIPGKDKVVNAATRNGGARALANRGSGGGSTALANVARNAGLAVTDPLPTDIGTVATTYDPLNPDKALPITADRAEKLDTAGANAVDVITSAGAALHTLGQERETRLAQKIVTTDAMLADQDAMTRDLQRRITPIFAERTANSERMVEVAKMSPIKRAFLSIFNPKYDMDHLKEVDGALSSQAREIGEEYSVANNISDNLLKTVDRRYLDQDSLSVLKVTDLTQDIGIANTGWQMADQRLSDATKGVVAGEAITRAQVVARDSILDNLTDGQINTGLAQAGRGGGSTVIGGVSISEAQFKQAADKRQAQASALEQQQIALKSGRMDLAEKAEEQYIAYMTPEQRAEAVKNGGNYKGRQLNVNLLSRSYSADLQNTQNSTAVLTNSTEEPTYRSTVDTWNQQNKFMMGRMQSVLGPNNVPAPMLQHQQAMVALSNQWAAKIKAAPLQSQPLLRSQALAELGKLQGSWGDIMDKTAQGMTRDPDAQIVLGSWFKGQPVSGDQAVRGIIALTRDGTSLSGLNLQGPAKEAFARAQMVIRKAIEEQNAPLDPLRAAQGARKRTQKEFDTELRGKVATALGSTYSNGISNMFLNNIPGIAKGTGDPAGKIDPKDYRSAIASGDQKGLARIAQDLGWTNEQVMSVFGPGGKGQAGYEQLAGNKPGTPSYVQMNQRLHSYQASNFLRDLDTTASATPGFRPSKAFVDFINSPKYQQALGNWSRQNPYTSFGDMLSTAVSGSNLADTMGKMGQIYSSQYASNLADDQATARSKAANYNGSPVKRMRVAMGAIPGMSEADATALAGGVVKYLDQAGAMYEGAGGQSAGSSDEAGDMGARLDSVILNGKFQDPHLESLRKLAAKNWKAHTEVTDGVVANLTKMMGW